MENKEKDIKEMELLTIKEVATLMRVSIQSVSAWIKSGKLKAIKPVKAVRIERTELERFLRGE